jgi:ferrous iron transport protein B
MAFLAPAFFGRSATVVSWGLVAVNLVLLMGVGIAVNRLVLKGEQTAFIMEMPLYHLPNLRTIALYVWQNMLSFVKKAGTVIVIVSALVWALSTFPHGDVETSYLAGLGQWLEPIGGLMGFGDWRLITALLASFVAKENTIAVVGILLGEANGVGLAERVATLLEPRGALAFLVMQMLFIPCLATWAVIRQETGSWKWTAVTVGLQLGISLTAAVLVYQVLGLF